MSNEVADSSPISRRGVLFGTAALATAATSLPVGLGGLQGSPFAPPRSRGRRRCRGPGRRRLRTNIAGGASPTPLFPARSRQLQEGDPRHAGAAAHRSAQLVPPHAHPRARLPARQLVVLALASRLSRLVRADLPRFERRPAIRVALLGLDQGAARTQADVRGCPQPERPRLHQGRRRVRRNSRTRSPKPAIGASSEIRTPAKDRRRSLFPCSSDLFGFPRICGSTCSTVRWGRSGSISQTHAV